MTNVQLLRLPSLALGVVFLAVPLRAQSGNVRIVQPYIRGLDGQSAALRHRITRVQGKVQDRAFELTRIGFAFPQIITSRHLDLDGFAQSAAQQIGHSGYQFIQLNHRRREGLFA